MTEITDKKIRFISDHLVMTRGAFEAAYDEFALNHGSAVFKVIAFARQQADPKPVETRDQFDFFSALQSARDAGWLGDFVIARFAELVGSTATTAAQGQTEQTLQGELESIVIRDRRFEDAKDIETGTLAASRRSCQIICETEEGGQVTIKAIGSGFLVGPHLVLTNYHVIETLLDAGTGKPDPALPRPAARFDYHAGSSTIAGPEIVPCDEDWLVSSSPQLDIDATAAALTDNLDFAILKLAGLPGHARGYYKLEVDEVFAPPRPGDLMEVWQFPFGMPMKVQGGLRTAPPDGFGFEDIAQANHPRIFYMINTARGSSGSLVLDSSKRPVALHDAGFKDNTTGEVRPNRGVPLKAIAERAISDVTQQMRDLPDNVGWHQSRNFPILGRPRLQQLIFDAQSGPVKLITVLTTPNADGVDARIPKIGRSYTRMILEACLPADAHHIVVFNAASVDPDPFLTARRLVAVVRPDLVATLPLASGETTQDADSTGILVDDVVAALLSAAPGKTIWLMIDDIDAHPIGTQWGSSAFLFALYRRAVVEPNLRMVLIGLPHVLEGLRDLQSDGILRVETLSGPPDEGEITHWIAAHLGNGAPWPAEFAPRLTRMIRSAAREAIIGDDNCLTEATAEFLSRHARAAFRRLEASQDD